MTKVPSAPLKTARSEFSPTLCATTRASGTGRPADPFVTPRRTPDAVCPYSRAAGASAAIWNAIHTGNAAGSDSPRFARHGLSRILTPWSDYPIPIPLLSG